MNSNTNDGKQNMTKVRKILFFVVLIIVFGFILFILGYNIKTKDYKKVTATIVDIRVDSIDNMGQEKSAPYTYFETYLYVINGKEYRVEQKVYKPKEINNTKIIKYNPLNPEELYNQHFSNGMLAIIIFLIIFEILLYIIIKKHEI